MAAPRRRGLAVVRGTKRAPRPCVGRLLDSVSVAVCSLPLDDDMDGPMRRTSL